MTNNDRIFYLLSLTNCMVDLQFCRDEENQGYHSRAGEFFQLTHHGQTQIKQCCSPERVRQTIYKLLHEGRDLLAQQEVRNEPDHHHKDNGVFDHLKDHLTQHSQLTLLVKFPISPPLHLTERKA